MSQQRTILTRFLLWRKRNLNTRSFIIILSVIIGITAGFSAILLKTAVFKMRGILLNEFQFDYYNFLILIYPTVGVFLTVLMKKFVIKDSVKHNITSILYSISKLNSRLKTHKLFSSIIGATLTAGFGGSIGLESPIISTGSAIGSNIGRVLHLNYKQITLLLACGASGAISAIFNTPIAGVIFAIEVLLIDMTRYSLIPLLMASVSGTITTKIFIDKEILFDVSIHDSFTLSVLPFYIIFAILSGMLSLYFTRIYLLIEGYFDKIQKTRNKILGGSLVLGVLIFLFPALWGEGFATIKHLLVSDYNFLINNSPFFEIQNNIVVIILFFSFLCLLKVFATAITIGAGGIGGIFAPSLFTGAINGFLFVFVLQTFGIADLSVTNFVLVGMGAVLSGVLHAPLTAMFLIAEITSGYELIVPLMLTSTISFITVKYFEHNSIITMQIAKRGELITHHKDKAVLKFMNLHSVIETDLMTVPLNSNLRDLVKIISKSKRNIFPVISEGNLLAGIILLDDVRELMFNTDVYDTTLVRNLMQCPPSHIDIHDPMDTVMKKFNQSKAWNLPVIEEGKYVGFVSKSKMFSVYRQLLVDLSDD